MLKLAAILVCITTFGVHANAYSQRKISVQLKNGKLTAFFDEIQQQTSYSVFYSDKLVSGKQASIHAIDEDLFQVLEEVLSRNNLKYSVNGKQITIKAKASAKLSPKEKYRRQDSLVKVRGRVYDTHEPPQTLPGVSIKVKGTDEGVTSDAEGYFDINVGTGQTLIFSMVGYLPEEYPITKSLSSLNISLKEDVSALDEVVVVGMTEQQKKHIASSVANLNVSSNIAGKPITSLSQSLQGGVTGLAVSQGSALPGGDAATVKIRGISTLGNSDPLVLVDGIPMDMNTIDPITVESITVLKDAAAAAIYGSRAANGVIVITTKRGVPGRVVVTYDGYYGMQSPTYMADLVDAPMYMRMYNEAQVNTGNSPFYSQTEIDSTSMGIDPVRYPNTNWIDLMVDKTAPITSHSLSLSGGNSLARFAVTGNYLNQQGMIPNTSSERYNIRANTTVTLSPKFSINLDVLAIKLDWDRPNRIDGSGGNRMLEDIHRVPPTILPKYPDNGSGKTIYGRYVDIVNPLAYAEKGGIRQRENGQASINFQPKWEVFPNFNLKGQFSFRLNSDVTHDTRDAFNFFDYYSGNLVQTWSQQRESTMARTTYYYVGGSADYSYRLNKHYFFALAGYSQEQTNSNSWDIWSIMSSYAKLNYSYDDRYLLEAVARIDGSSRFGPGHKYGFFPSFALGWNIHNESFLKGQADWLNNLKLRASYGQLGNENIGLYKYQTLIGTGDGVESTWGNPDITWETVNMLDIGLDIGLFKNNKIEITADYYDKLTKDIILTPQVSYVGGLGNVPVNAGEVRNRGFEFSLNYFDQLGSNTSLSIRPGFTYNKNTVEKLYGGIDVFSNATTINREGYSVSSIFGYHANGLLQEGDFDAKGNALLPVATNAHPGDVRYIDVTGDGIIDDNDQTVIGNPVPKINYFTNVKVSYRNFDLEFLLQGTGESDLVLGGMLAYPLDMSFDGGVPTKYFAERYWTPQRTDAMFPRLSVAPAVNKLSSDFWIQNTAYLRVKFMQFGFNFKKDTLLKYGIHNARIYANVQNPFTISSVKLIDPESQGNQWTYGIMRAYTIGLNVQF
ncbi:TonB-dependent receptor [Olivibacter ginsenosidimutans]|uniref:TonB-dependent receptor n=1 Tax=Olivibacter ginsenosidimutans TaxID=1176537 RepID=A0ABP9CAP1_9SPHI